MSVLPILSLPWDVPTWAAAIGGVLLLVGFGYAALAFLVWLKTLVIRFVLRHALWVGIGSLGGVGALWAFVPDDPVGTVLDVLTGLL